MVLPVKVPVSKREFARSDRKFICALTQVLTVFVKLVPAIKIDESHRLLRQPSNVPHRQLTASPWTAMARVATQRGPNGYRPSPQPARSPAPHTAVTPMPLIWIS
jgi:hypothetical protein